MNEKPKKSITHDRAIKGYLDPIVNKNIPRLIEITGMNKSEIVNTGVRALMERENIIKVINPK